MLITTSVAAISSKRGCCMLYPSVSVILTSQSVVSLHFKLSRFFLKTNQHWGYVTARSDRPDSERINEHTTEKHWSSVRHILCYVKQVNYCSPIYQTTRRCMQAFCDADWVSDKSDRKSFSGCVFTSAGAAISPSSKNQQSTTLSTAEAEYVAMCHTARKVIWFQKFMQ